MKYAVDIRHLTAPFPTGVGHYTKHLVEHLAILAPNDEFFLCASGTESVRKNVPTFSAPNIRVHQIDLPNRVVSAYMKAPFGPALEDIFDVKPDAWIFPNLNMIRTKRPYAVTVHDLSFALMPEYFSKKTRLWHQIVQPKHLLKNARIVLCVSERTQADAVAFAHIPKEQTAITPLGVTDAFSATAQKNDVKILQQHSITSPYFLTLSTIEPRKNLASVIQAYADWRNTQPTGFVPHLVLAGAAGFQEKRVLNMIRASRYAENIHLLAYVRDADRPALMRNATALLFPSYYEGFGLPVLEAMTCGTPVIASFTGSLPEIAGNAAMYVDPYNVTDLVHAMNAVYTEQTTRERLTALGLTQAKLFTWQRTALHTLAALSRVF